MIRQLKNRGSFTLVQYLYWCKIERTEEVEIYFLLHQKKWVTYRISALEFSFKIAGFIQLLATLQKNCCPDCVPF